MSWNSSVVFRAQDNSGFRKLLRDVGVNILANLIAAALIYLLGVIVGLFPSARVAVIAASSIVLVGVVTVQVSAFFLTKTSRSSVKRNRASRYVAMFAGLAGICMATIAMLAVDKPTDGRVWLAIYGAFGILYWFLDVFINYLDRRDNPPRTSQIDASGSGEDSNSMTCVCGRRLTVAVVDESN